MTDPNDFRGIAELLNAISDANSLPEPARWERVRTGPRGRLCDLLRWLVWQRDDGRCHYCGTSDKPTEIDHVQPWSAGGPDTATNLRVLCRDCNQVRSNYLTLDGPHLKRLLPVTPRCDDCLAVPYDPRHHSPRLEHACGHCGQIWDPSAADVHVGPVTLAFCGWCLATSNVTNPMRLL